MFGIFSSSGLQLVSYSNVDTILCIRADFNFTFLCSSGSISQDALRTEARPLKGLWDYLGEQTFSVNKTRLNIF